MQVPHSQEPAAALNRVPNPTGFVSSTDAFDSSLAAAAGSLSSAPSSTLLSLLDTTKTSSESFLSISTSSSAFRLAVFDPPSTSMTLPDFRVFATPKAAPASSGSCCGGGVGSFGFNFNPAEDPAVKFTDDVVVTVVPSSALASEGALKVKASGVTGKEPGSKSTGEGGFGEAKSKQISGDSLLSPPLLADVDIDGVKSNLGIDVMLSPI